MAEQNKQAPKVEEAPDGFVRMKGGNCSVDGKEYLADKNGVVIVPEKAAMTLVYHGFEAV